MKEVYVSYNGTLYVPYIAGYVFHGYTGTLWQGGKTADWLFISRVLALSADQSKAAQVN